MASVKDPPITGLPRSRYWGLLKLVDTGLDSDSATAGAHDGRPAVLAIVVETAPPISEGVHNGAELPTSTEKLLRNRCDGDTQPALPGAGLPKLGAGVSPYSPAHGGSRVVPYPNRSVARVQVRWSPSPLKTPFPSTKRSEKPGGQTPSQPRFAERHHPAGREPQSGRDDVPNCEAHMPDTKLVRLA